MNVCIEVPAGSLQVSGELIPTDTKICRSTMPVVSWVSKTIFVVVTTFIETVQSVFTFTGRMKKTVGFVRPFYGEPSCAPLFYSWR